MAMEASEIARLIKAHGPGTERADEPDSAPDALIRNLLPDIYPDDSVSKP